MTDAPADNPRITGETRVYAIIGWPIAQARSPVVFNPLFRAAAKNAVLVPLEVHPDRLATVVRGLFACGNFDGIIATVPHKAAMMDLVDAVRPTGRLVGAINAARREEDGRWVGDMFDGRGCVRGLRAQGHEPAGRRVLLVGAGGAGSAVAVALAEAGAARITVFDVDRDKAARLVARVADAFPRVGVEAGPPAPRADDDTVVNATPLGMVPHDPLPIDPAAIQRSMLVVDVIMKPEVTPLLHAAAAKGCRVQPGRHMLDGQAAEVAAFFGIDA